MINKRSCTEFGNLKNSERQVSGDATDITQGEEISGKCNFYNNNDI